MIDREIVCEFTDLERGVEETSTLGFTSAYDAALDCELHAAILGARYNSLPRQRGATRWEIREPGELLVVIKARRIFE